MKRFVVSVPPGPGGMIHLYEKDYHYLVRVRRLKSGMCFDAVLPGGTECRVRILSTVDNILIGECLEQVPSECGQVAAPIAPQTSQAAQTSLAIFQGLPRGTKMDLIARQAAELGVSLVAPFQSEYSTVKLSKDPDEKVKRWERIVREARQQSGSATETKVLPPRGFEALLAYWESIKKEYKRPLGIMLHQEPLEKGSFHGYLGNCPDFVAIAIGPEGGFSPGELSLLFAAGFKPVVIGNTILRTETAALYGAAAVQIILLESEAWIPGQTELCSSESPST